jgi:hypothetical protein
MSTPAVKSEAPQTSAKPGQYEIGRPAGVCAVTGQQILPGERFMAALRETPTGLERLDIAIGAWESFDRTNLLAFWQTIQPEANKAKKLLVDDSVLMELFERLADAAEPAKVSFRFVLGLILMRKRLLAYESTHHDDAGRDVWRVRLKGREQPLEMVDPKLSEDQYGDVTQQLGQILNSEL